MMNDLFSQTNEDPFFDPKARRTGAGSSTLPPIEERGQLENFGQDLDKPFGRMKQKPKTNHMPRSKEYFEKRGYLVFKVESWMPTGGGSMVKIDFLGLFDLMAVKPGHPSIGIQVSSKSDSGSHITKMLSSDLTSFNKRRKCDNMLSWLECGFLATVLCWEKVGAHWVPTERKITLEQTRAAIARKRTA